MYYSRFPNVFTKLDKIDSNEKNEYRQPYYEANCDCPDFALGITLSAKSYQIKKVEYKEDKVVVTWNDEQITECLYNDIDRQAFLSKCIVQKLFDRFYLNEVFDAFSPADKSVIEVSDLMNSPFDTCTEEYQAKVEHDIANKIKLKNQKEFEEKRKALEEEYRLKLQEEFKKANIFGIVDNG